MPGRAFIVLVLGMCAAYLLFFLVVPLDLIPDEAYYWDWSRHPAWCYYNKPPMVAWVIWASCTLFGQAAWAVRLPGVVCASLMLCALYALGARMYGARVGFWAALALATTPGGMVNGLLITTDDPFLCAWAFTLYFTWRALDAETRRGWWWCAAGLACAVGILSKQTMLAMPVLLGVFLLMSPRGRAQFRSGWLYVFGIIAASALVPIVWWNVQNHWVVAHHTAEHFRTQRFSVVAPLVTFGYFIGTQLMTISPVFFVLAVAVAAACLWHARTCGDRERFLAVFCVLPLALVALVALRVRILPNWPAPFYLSGAVLAVAWACGAVSCGRRLDMLRVCFKPGVVIGAVTGVAVVAAMSLSAVPALSSFNVQPENLGGWREMAAKAGDVLETMPRKDRTFVIGCKRYIASELAFYMPGEPCVYEWPCDIYIGSQYGIWSSPADKTGWDAVFVAQTGKKLLPPVVLAELFNAFERVEGPTSFTASTNPRQIVFYKCHGLKQWPAFGHRHNPTDILASPPCACPSTNAPGSSK